MKHILNAAADLYEKHILPKLKQNQTRNKKGAPAPEGSAEEEKLESPEQEGEEDEAKEAGGGKMKKRLAPSNGNNPDQENDMPRPPNGALKPAKSPVKPMPIKQPNAKQTAKKNK